MVIIELQFKKTTVALAGNPYGKRIFDEQVRPKLSNSADEEVTITIPMQITYVTSSFIQGFFDYWLRTMNCDEIKEKVIVKAGTDRIVSYIWDNLL